MKATTTVSSVLAEVFVTSVVAKVHGVNNIIPSTNVIVKGRNVSISTEGGIPLDKYKVGKPIAERRRLFRQVINGLTCLEHHNISHADIKLSNVVVIDGVAYVIDFGALVVATKEARKASVSALWMLGAQLFVDGVENLSDIEANKYHSELTVFFSHPRIPRSCRSLMHASNDNLPLLKVIPPARLCYVSEGLTLIYTLGVRYALEPSVISTAAVRYSEYCGLGYQCSNHSLIAYVAVLLTLGLSGKSSQRVESLFNKHYSLQDAVYVVQRMAPHNNVYSFSTLKLVAFTHIPSNHDLASLIPNNSTSVSRAVCDLATQYGTTLPSRILTDTGIVIEVTTK